MLDDFRLEQQIAYKTIINSVKKNKVSHAYIIETNGYSKSFEFVISFVKYLFCPRKYSNKNETNCGLCNQCINIDKNEFVELKIIESEGQWIKKNQLDELFYDFSKKSILGNKKIYVIKDAAKLNISSSNSLLKFLEEPEDGIIAILVVDNIYQLLSTIVSRCQIISLKKERNNKEISSLEKIYNILNNEYNNRQNCLLDSQIALKVEKVLEFILYYEENHKDSILYISKLWNDFFKEREDIYNGFTILLLFYKDVLNNKINGKVEIFGDYIQYILKIENKNTVYSLINKINVVIDLREKIKFNINNNLLMNKLIIMLERCDYND